MFSSQNEKSRTIKSLENSIVALAFYFVNLILQFFSRKIFLDYLGAEVLGLNTTVTNLLQFLNLAELGVGAAIACTLYGPLFAKDMKTINEIVSLQGWMYRRIAWVVVIGAFILMCFFPWIFSKMLLPLWYAYASFGILLFSALLSYFVNYKQIVLSADQKEYKIQYSYKASMLFKVLCQIFAIYYFKDGYVLWLVLEFIFAIVASVMLNWIISRTYPQLKTNIAIGKELKRKYPDITIKIKQLFFHKIGSFALSQTSPFIIYAYTSLTLVAFYGNYMLIITGVTYLMVAIFNSMNAGVGNLVAEGDKERIMSVFGELFSVRFLLTSVMCFGVYSLTPSFITLWIGAKYVMDNTTLILMVFIMYINLSRSTVDAYINAYGLFSDVWAPIVEALINVGMSILLGYFFGLHGVLGGIIISSILVIICWKPYFLFRSGLKASLRQYITMYMRHLIALSFCIFMAYWVFKQITIDFVAGFGSLLIYGITTIIAFAFVLMLILCVLERGMRRFMNRIFKLILG